MNIHIQSIKFDADQKLIDFTKSKLQKINKFIDSITHIDVSFSLSNASDEKNKVTKIKLEVPGHDLFTEHQCKSFEEGVDVGIDALKVQITKYKERKNK